MNNIDEQNNEKSFVGTLNEYKFTINGSDKNVIEAINERESREISDGMNKFMPLGSVISIKGIEDSYKVIVGYNYNTGEKIYDYIACDYPFGINSEHKPILFNHEQIDKCYHVGFSNPYGKEYRKQLLESNMANKLNSK